MFEISVFLRDKLVARSSFTADEVRIGRSPENEIQIDNLGLSRYHASIEKVDGAYFVKDFGSQNGTVVNGENVVGRRALSDGDRIGLGKFVILFRTDEQAKTDAAPAPRDQAAFHVAGETLVARNASPDLRERTCPFVAYLESPDGEKVHPLARDLTLVGSGAACDLKLEGDVPERAAAIVRGWRGFTLLALGARVQKNGRPVESRVDLAAGDQLAFGDATFKFHAGRPNAGP